MVVFDVGNTDTVVGFFRGAKLYEKFRIRSLKSENSVFFEYRILNFMLEKSIDKGGLRKAVISSVVPQLTPFFATFCKKFLSLEPLIVQPAQSGLLKIGIDTPAELGSDLFLNALASHRKYGGNCIVVDFGTALTFTVVSAEGEIKGVTILPGLNTALKSLSSETSLLPEVLLEKPDRVIGTNTTHSIRAGIYYGYESLIRGMVVRIQNELEDPAKVIATGGLSWVISELQDIFFVTEPDLTLKGMYFYGSE